MSYLKKENEGEIVFCDFRRELSVVVVESYGVEFHGLARHSNNDIDITTVALEPKDALMLADFIYKHFGGKKSDK